MLTKWTRYHTHTCFTFPWSVFRCSRVCNGLLCILPVWLD